MKFDGATLPDKFHPFRGLLDLYGKPGHIVARKWPQKAPYKRQAMLRQQENEQQKRMKGLSL